MIDSIHAPEIASVAPPPVRQEPDTAPIGLEKVSKHYATEKALDDVSLSFPANVTTAVVGSSGSGKSTLLQMINGLVRPTSGTIRLFGKPIDYDDLPGLRRQIGYAVQGTGLFPHVTVEGNITLLARLARWDGERIRARTAELMKLVGLPAAYARRYPHELSGGQQQRVGLCRALMLDPPLLLLDEPFGALDPVTRNEIHREFLKLQEVGPRTTVLVTHDLREAVKLAQRMVILHQGRVEQSGRCADVLANPANDFVRGFLDAQLSS
jgi:osmoprotectant transport system ATP-binding protein